MNGKFIIVEGGDGAGKSTLVQNLAESLMARGAAVMTTREPGGSPKAEEIRRLMLERAVGDNFLPESEMLLVYAARLQHLHDTIIPALQAGKVVLCDRFEASTYGYQVVAQGGDEKLFQFLHQRVVDVLSPLQVPCWYLHLEVSVAVARQRHATAGKTRPDVFDGREVEFHQKTKQGYETARQVINPLFEHFIIDADQTPEKMVDEALVVLGCQ